MRDVCRCFVEKGSLVEFHEETTPPMAWEHTGRSRAGTPHPMVACEVPFDFAVEVLRGDRSVVDRGAVRRYRRLVLAPALSDDTALGAGLRRRLRGTHLAAPEVVDLEVQSVLCRAVRGGLLTEQRARRSWRRLRTMPLHRAGHRPLLTRIWALRDTVSTYDAAYVALAEALGCPLLSADRRLAGAPGVGCEVEVLRPASPPGDQRR